ncbi:MAG: isocitrate/isopropylmalate family dehydrogenase [Mariprofundaceae bacterium]
MAFDNIKIPADGEKITVGEDGVLNVSHQPVVSFIEGDGVGPDIWSATQSILDCAISRAYQGEREIAWMEVFAGEKAWNLYGQNDDTWLPAESLQALSQYTVALKGPLTMPGNCTVASLSQQLDLPTCQRSVGYFTGAPSPVKRPQDVNMTFFRENSVGIYAGLDYKPGSDAVKKAIDFLQNDMGVEAMSSPESLAIGMTFSCREATKRLVRAAIQYAIKHKKSSVTLVYKSIMNQTEESLCSWAYQVAKEEFDAVEVSDGSGCELPNGMLIKDCMAAIALQQVLTEPSEFDVIASLDGDCLSDVVAAQVGGIAMVPTANINESSGRAVFEVSHGTEASDAGKNIANPSSMVLSGAMMLRYMGWSEAADLIEKGILGAIRAKTVTYDLERRMDDASKVSTSDFALAVIDHMDDAAISGEETEQYDALAAKFKELFESSADKTSELAHITMEKARQQLTVAGAFTEEQGQKLKGFLERDFGQIATNVRDEAKLKFNPSRLGSGALASISSLLQVAGSALSGVAEKTEQSLACRSGEITSAGTLTCKACKHSICFKKTGRIPPCPSCHKTDFSKGY